MISGGRPSRSAASRPSAGRPPAPLGDPGADGLSKAPPPSARIPISGRGTRRRVPPARPPAGRPARGTASTTRSRARPRGRTRSSGIAAVLAADAELERRVGAAAALDSPSASARRRRRRRWSRTGSTRSMPSSMYAARNLPSASSRDRPSVVCVRSFVPKEKKSACGGDLRRRSTAARGSSIIVPIGLAIASRPPPPAPRRRARAFAPARSRTRPAGS